jgi:hypothetical protein
VFTERPQGHGIVFVGHHEPGTPIKMSISAGDTATLRIGEEHILIRNIEPVGSGRYKGIVYGFEPSFGLEYEGLKLEQEVQFSESQVFGCGG